MKDDNPRNTYSKNVQTKWTEPDLSVLVGDDEVLVHKISSYMPDNFIACQLCHITKKWYQFWIPKKIYLYSTIEKRKNKS